MANIIDKISAIRIAVFGRDVRSSIADGIDSINTEVESTTSKQDALKVTFDGLIINAGSSNAEIVAGRMGEVSLPVKMGKIDEQLASNALQLALKAEKSEVVAVSNQIGNIIAQSGTSSTEVVDLRTGVDGTVYTTAKQRADAEMARLNGIILPTNLNKNEGTLTPTYLPTIAETSNSPATRMVLDSDSPMKGKLAYKHQIFRTTAPGAANYLQLPYLPDLASKPNKICFGFWAKDSDINTLYASTRLMEYWIYIGGKFISFNFDVKALIVSELNIAVVSKTIPGAGLIDSYDAEAKCLNKNSGYSYIRVTLSNIVWTSGFIGDYKLIYWYNIYTPLATLLNGAQLNITNLSLLYNADIVNGYYVYGDGGGVIQNPSQSGLQKQITDLGVTVASIPIPSIAAKPLVIVKSVDDIYIRSSWSTTQDLVEHILVKNSSDYYNNKLYQFSTTGLIPKETVDAAIATTTPTMTKYSDDDTAPMLFNSTYIGASHGAAFVRCITANAHGKTNADNGSEWVDGIGIKFYIIRIVDVNTLWVLSEDKSVTGFWDFRSITGSTLTHSANATHTGVITITATTTTQLLPAIKNQIKKFMLDGTTEIIADGVYYCDHLDVVNSYDISDVTSLLYYIREYVGNVAEPTYDRSQVATVARVVITYKFSDNGSCTIFSSFKPTKAISLSYVGFTQAMAVLIPSGGTICEYVPKTVPFVAGSTTYDLKSIRDITALADSLELVKSTWESPLSPPDRFIQFAKNSDGITKANNYGFTLGYCPEIGVGIPSIRKDLIDSAMNLFTTQKQYPKGISTNSTSYASNTIPANTNFDMVAFRCPINYNNDTDATNISWYYANNVIYLMLDYHKNIDKSLKLPDKFIGKKVEVVEKSSGFTLNSSFVSYDGINIKVIGSYGCATLKIS